MIIPRDTNEQNLKVGDIAVVKSGINRRDYSLDRERAEYEGKKLLITGVGDNEFVCDFLEPWDRSDRYNGRPISSLERYHDLSLLSDIII